MAALQIKNIPTGAGDDFKIDATYAKGDTKNVISTSGGFAELRDVRRHGRSGATRASASVRQLMPCSARVRLAVPPATSS